LKSGSLKLLEPSGPVQSCNGIALPFLHLWAKNFPKENCRVFLAFCKNNTFLTKKKIPVIVGGHICGPNISQKKITKSFPHFVKTILFLTNCSHLITVCH
jgi:hypothetical protein